MCRNVRVLYNFEPPATEDEIRAAATQYIRKISGFVKPSSTNERAFNQAVNEVTTASANLLVSLKTSAPPRNRAEAAAKAHQRAVIRFGLKGIGGN
jgi:hypothetical protein